MKIALVHEHLTQDGGAEKVLVAFQNIFPSAPTFTLVYDPHRANALFSKRDIRTSFIQRLPFGLRNFKWYLPLMPLAVESYNLQNFDVVVSSASAFAKGVLTRPETVHICYCHSPTRYLWNDTHVYVAALPYPSLLKRIIEKELSSLRLWDRLAADRVDHFIANSRAVQERIQKYYRRESTIIHPPVETEKFSLARSPENYYLTGGRLVFYKRYDVTVQAFNRLGLPLKIFGTGPEEGRLRALARKNIEFLGRIPDLQMRQLYSRALAFIHPQEEDFGITAVESMASGRPVIAYAKGGALETVRPGVTGTLFDEQSWEALADAVLRFRPQDFRPEDIRAWAEQFSLDRFTERFRSFVMKHSTTSHRRIK